MKKPIIEHSVSQEFNFQLYIAGIGTDINDEILYNYFSKFYRSVTSAKVIYNINSGLSKGYGFVKFKDANEYERALNEMNGRILNSRIIKVK
jgi:RNA recognition motif-containing protein